jgi:UDP-2,3-diacylglucosamine pyrophosphatase LpxH
MSPAAQDYNLLLVSDLHLSEGIRLNTNKYSQKEDFFFDREFTRFLGYYQDLRPRDGRKWHLIILGDCFDLLQLTSVDGATLDCSEEEAISKLDTVARGHAEFFEALAGFVANGNLLTIVKGNHDVELHYPRVRQALVQQLQDAYKRKLAAQTGPQPVPRTTDVIRDSVRFSDWFYYEKNLLWAEHGNQYDETNAFKFFLSPLLPKSSDWPDARRDEIDLPWGSFFVRYLFNSIEQTEPFADNMKPTTKFIFWLLKKHPITALRFAVKEGGLMLRKVRRAWITPAPDLYAAREREHNARLAELAAQAGINEATLHAIDRLRAPSILKETTSTLWKTVRGILRFRLLPTLILLAAALVAIAGLFVVSPMVAAVLPEPLSRFIWNSWSGTVAGRIVGQVVGWLRWPAFVFVIFAAVATVRWLFTGEEVRGPSNLAKKAENIADCLGVQYVVMGHTHDADLRNLSLDPRGTFTKREYFNTGTWTKVFSEEERLIRADSQFAFMQGLRQAGRLQLKLMEWDDEAGEPRLLKLFETEREAARPRAFAQRAA